MAELRIGLEGVAIAESAISHVDGEKGELIYRGYWVEDIVQNHCFEDIVHLLWFGHLPDAAESKAFKAKLAANRELPDYIKQLINLLPKTLTPMAVLRTALSASIVPGSDWPPTVDQAIVLLAQAPIIVAYYYNHINGKAERKSRDDLGHAANYLYLLHGVAPEKSHERALDMYWMLSADHDMNASTFTARVVTSTMSDIVSSVVAAIGAMIGPLHGGAPSHVDDMLDAIGTEENAEPWLRDQIEKGERLMGFGHRVYKTYDPRGAALKQVVREFSADNPLFKLSLHVEEVAVRLLNEYKPGRNLYPNLEFWAAGVLRTINLPRELYTPSFTLSRIGGWTAQIIEQSANNRLIRPSCIYTGPQPKGERVKKD
ncbi:MAG: citrate synthase/methylcitrate synthase [Legionellales bacterium]|nr:citrate synthase/methylcitrate synthase [Legionellales bacterium]